MVTDGTFGSYFVLLKSSINSFYVFKHYWKVLFEEMRLIECFGTEKNQLAFVTFFYGNFLVRLRTGHKMDKEFHCGYNICKSLWTVQLHVTLIHVLLYSEYDYVDQLLLENIITNFHQITAWNSRLRTGHKNSYGRDLLKTVEYFNHKVFIYLLQYYKWCIYSIYHAKLF